MPSKPFLQAVSDLVLDLRWPERTTPASLLADWRGFVDQCQAGYAMGIYEYRNDLRVRTLIEKILTATDLSGYAELATFREEVEKVDAEFRRLLQSGAQLGRSSDAWWEKGVPKKAGASLASDILDESGIKVEVAE